MKSFSNANLFLATILGFASLSAYAADGETTFKIDHDVLRYSSTSIKPDAGKTEKTTNFVTTPNDVTVSIYWNDFGLYVTPGNTGGLVSGSYFVSKEVELGLNLGFNNSKVEDEPAGTTTATRDEKASTYGIFGTYYLTIDDKSSAEFSLNLNLGNTKDTVKPANGTSTTTVDGKSTEVTLLAQYAIEVAKHFAYVPGILYSHVSDKNDLPGGKTTKTSGLALNIAHFRYIF